MKFYSQQDFIKLNHNETSAHVLSSYVHSEINMTRGIVGGDTGHVWPHDFE